MNHLQGPSCEEGLRAVSSDRSTQHCGESQRENLFKVIIKTLLLETRSQRKAEDETLPVTLLRLRRASRGCIKLFLDFISFQRLLFSLFHLLSSMLGMKRGFFLFAFFFKESTRRIKLFRNNASCVPGFPPGAKL